MALGLFCAPWNIGVQAVGVRALVVDMIFHPSKPGFFMWFLGTKTESYIRLSDRISRCFFPDNFSFFFEFWLSNAILWKNELEPLDEKMHIKIWDLTSYNDPPQKKHVCWGSHVGGGCGNWFFVEQQFLDPAPHRIQMYFQRFDQRFATKKNAFCFLAWLPICGTFFLVALATGSFRSSGRESTLRISKDPPMQGVEPLWCRGV